MDNLIVTNWVKLDNKQAYRHRFTKCLVKTNTDKHERQTQPELNANANITLNTRTMLGLN